MQGLIKDFKDVKIGDLAFYHPNAGGIEEASLIAPILWKGSYEEFKNSKYLSLYNVVEEKEEDEYNLDECDLVVLDESFLEGPTLYTYDGDPCSCVVFIKSIATLLTTTIDSVEELQDLQGALWIEMSLAQNRYIAKSGFLNGVDNQDYKDISTMITKIVSVECEEFIVNDEESDDYQMEAIYIAFQQIKQIVYDYFS